jgi:sugar/nucleoside kinase (ribokinase family)
MSGEFGRIISLGNVIIDVTAHIPSLPERGGDVFARNSGITPGGGFNVLVAAARQGLRAAYGGAHGTGPFGTIARDALRAEHIEVLLEQTAEIDTGYDVALIDDAGERTFITAVGAEATLTRERLSRLELRPDDAVYVSGYGLIHSPNREAISEFLAQLPSETTVFADPGPLVLDIPQTTLRAVRNRATWWSCNLREARLATGEQNPLDAAQALLATGRRSAETGAAIRGATAGAGGVVVRLGADGCLIAQAGDAFEHIPGFAVDAVDTNGAGDAHSGALLACLARGDSPVEAARRANACAAIAVSRNGPASAPTSTEVDDFLGESIR